MHLSNLPKLTALVIFLVLGLQNELVQATPQTQKTDSADFADAIDNPAFSPELSADSLLRDSQQAADSLMRPSIEHSSLLDAFTVKFRGQKNLGQTGGHLVLNQKHEIMGVHFPEGAKLTVDLYKAGDKESLYHSDCRLEKSGGSAFTRIEVIDPGGYTFQGEGDYELRFTLDGEVITTLPFNVFFKKNDDAFDSKTYTFVDGDWSSLSYLSFSAESDVAPLKFNTWTRKVVFTTTPAASKMDITLLQGDEVVAVTAQGTIAWPEWQTREKTFAFPANQGGQVFNNTDLLKRSGKHTVRVEIEGKAHQYFNFEIRSGKIIRHPREAADYRDRTRSLCTRKIRLGLEETSHLFWLERSDSSESTSAPATAGPSAATKSKWVVQPDIDVNRPFQLKQTNIRMRKDMPVSIGDGIVAYATGRQGVGYFVVGEDKPKSIKNGQQFRGDLFFACGKLIMLATRNNVSVFSTQNGRSVDIPDDEIHLSYQTHALYGPRKVDADGYLIATVNVPAKLKSKTIINVIDMSGDNRPIIIPIKNSDFELRDISSIKVNAAAGKVAVGSKRRGAIYVADVASGATFKKYDVSGFDSFGEADMVLTDSHILYTDAAGYANVRLLDLATGDVTMPNLSQFGGGWGPVGASNGTRIAWSIKEPRNGWAFGDLKDGTEELPHQSTGQRDSNGTLGSGRSMAMASDGTVFIAGTRSVSQSNCLQFNQNGVWKMVMTADGKPVPAIDVAAGNSMVVFKSGKPSTSSEVNLAYATFGSEVEVSSPAVVDVGNEATNQSSDEEKVDEAKTPQDRAMEIENEIDRERMKVARETEETIFNALKLSMSESDAKKRARETALNGLKASGGEHLIEAYKEGWK